jgi:TctA family transporter
VAGVVRTDFGLPYLYEGIPLVPIIIGLFAIPEAIDLVVGNTPIATRRLETMLRDSRKDVMRGMAVAFRHWWLIVRSSCIGVFIGMLPGVGGSVAHWIAYANARQTEPGARESFGHGDVRGIIAADAANNSVDGGVLIPTVVFGIPGSGSMAIVLAMLIIYGMNPGPQMLTQNLDFTISLVYTIALANIIVVPIMLFFSPMIVRIAAIPPNTLAPIVIGVVTLAAFQATTTMSDLVIVLAFGVLGVFMKRYGWPRPPILIAVVLGDILEKYLWLSSQTYGWSMFARPQFVIILVGAVAITAWTFNAQKRAKLAASEAQAHDAPGPLSDR